MRCYQNRMFRTQQQSTARFRAAQFAHLRHLAIFGLVVDSGSFTLAAQRIGMGKSGVSRLIAELEDFVGVRLLNRSTRTLALTDEGRLLFADCTRLIDAAVEAFDKLDPDLPLAGTLKIAATTAYGHYVLPHVIEKFSKRHPDLNMHLTLGDGFLDLVDNGIDLAIRVGSPGPSPNYISRKIGDFRYRLFGQKDMLAGYPPVQSTQDLGAVAWLMSTRGATPSEWVFEKDGTSTTVAVTGAVTTDQLMARIELAKAGLGLIGVPGFVPLAALGGGMVEVLPDHRIVPLIPIYAVYPNKRFLSPKVAEFLECLVASYADKTER